MRYETSGIIGRFIALSWPAALGASVGGAWVYQAVLGGTTSVKLHMVFCMVYAAILAGVGFLAMSLAPCRNRGVAILVGLTVGLVAVAAGHYFVYQWAIDGGHTPVSMLEFLRQRAEQGFRVGRGVTLNQPNKSGEFSGWAAWVVWGLEALLLILTPTIVSMLQAGQPFCERCLRWATEDKEEFELQSPGQSLVAAVKGATSLVEVLPPDGSEVAGDGPGDTKLIYKIAGCPRCDQTDSLTVKHRTVKTKGSKVENVDSDLHKGILVGPEEVEIIRTILVGPEGQGESAPG